MPTGYTAKLYDGKPQTFQEFALDASRAMGAAIMQRDDPADVPIRPVEEVDSWYEESYNKALDKLRVLHVRNEADWVREEKSEREKENAHREESDREARGRMRRYRLMLVEVLDWQPPTPEHEAFKKFMVEQLESSIQFDAPFDRQVIEPRDWTVFKFQEISRAERAVESAKKSWDEQVARIESRNKWVADLFDSLGL